MTWIANSCAAGMRQALIFDDVAVGYRESPTSLVNKSFLRNQLLHLRH